MNIYYKIICSKFNDFKCILMDFNKLYLSIETYGENKSP